MQADNNRKEFKRAITDEQKVQRRQKILDAAKALFLKSDFSAVKITDIAKKTGLGKGSVFLYFKSKEDLFLALTVQELEAWYQEIWPMLVYDRGQKKMDGRELLDLLDRTFLSREALIRLLAVATTVLEQNSSYEQAAIYKRTLHDCIWQIGWALDQKIAYFGEGDGAKFLMYALTIIAGAYQMANPPEVICQVLEEKEYPLFEMDFRTWFLEMLQEILNGMVVRM